MVKRNVSQQVNFFFTCIRLKSFIFSKNKLYKLNKDLYKCVDKYSYDVKQLNPSQSHGGWLMATNKVIDIT